jgi:hypothetical protein
MEQAAPDKKPGRILSLYLPATLGVLAGAFTEPFCFCHLPWQQLLLVKAGASVGFFVFWWIAVMVCFHGYHFVRALFDHPGRSDPET